MDFYILNKKEELVSIISDTDALTANVDEKIDSYELLNISIKADSEEASLIEEEYYIVFKDITGWREYTIYEIEDEDSDDFMTTIRAELSSSELIDDIVEDNLAGISKDPELILEEILKNTRWKVGNVDKSIYNSSFNVNTSYMSALEAVTELAKSHSCEVRFSYQIDGNKVINRFVDLYKQFGEDKGKRFEVDKDINSIKRTVNTENIKTAIIPLSQEITEMNEETGEELNYVIDITNIEWSVAKGDPVDKPLGQNWLGDPEALESWGRLNSDGSKRNRFMKMEFDLDSAEAIISMAWVQLGRYTKPKATYEVEAVDLFAQSNGSEEYSHESTSLGDVVIAIDNYFAKPIQVKTRVVEIERDLLDSRNNKYVFGSSKPIFSVNTTIEAVEEVSKDIDSVLQDMSNVQKNLNGKNKVFRGSASPVGMIENDIWFRPHPSISGENQMLVYNGAAWEIQADTSELQDAGRLKFGTIDAGEVNVINLTADNITGGSLNLANGMKLTHGNRVIMGVNNSTGEVELNVSRLTVNASPVLTQEDLNDIELQDGKSAYEIAVEHGYKGTESQWIESLKGKDGKDGVAGEKGEDGRTQYLHVAYANFNDDIEDKELINPSYIRLNYDLSKTGAGNIGKGDYAVLTNRVQIDKNKTYKFRRPINIGTVEIFLYPDTGAPVVIHDLGNGNEFTIDMSNFSGDFTRMAFRDGANTTTEGYSLKEYDIQDFSTTDSAGRSYIGAYTDFIKADSNDPSMYQWSLFKGKDGVKGSDGKDGKDGVGVKSSVTVYALHTSGTTPPSNWQSGIPTPVKGSYQWTKTVTTYTDGSQSTTYNVSYLATDGENGEDGNGISVHLTSYALSASGETAPTTGWTTSIPTLEKGKYLWTRNSIRYTNGDLKTFYSTSYLPTDGQKGDKGDKGDRGAQGIQGVKGTDGTTYYTWIKYANTPTSGMSDSPSGKEYIGIAYNKITSTKSNNYSDYQWSLIKGADGKNGANGVKGEDGKTYYTWIKYADTADGANMSSSPSGKRYLGIAYNKGTSNASSNPLDYSWSPLYDNVIPGSINLLKDSSRAITKTSYLVNSYYMTEKMEADQVYTLTMKADIPSSQTDFGVYLNGSSVNLGKIKRQNGVWLYSLTFLGKSSTATNDFINIYNMPSNTSKATIHWAVLTKGNVPETDWVPASTDIVSPDKVISAINLSAEQVKIGGDKIILDGHTTVDGSFKVNGDSIVNGTLSADKIVGGSLNAKYFQLTDDDGNVIMSFDSANKAVRFNVDYLEILTPNGSTTVGRATDAPPVYYTWTKTAYSPNDSVLYDSIGDRTWVGQAYDKLTPNASNNPNAYSWQPIYSQWYDSKGRKLPNTPDRFANYPDYWAGFDRG